ncbi:MAG: hypothetical protein CMB99_15855 [Flavobacteriaceae bacterium]|nr:hypothetical protein [Flavobacteriaceae bacterium]
MGAELDEIKFVINDIPKPLNKTLRMNRYERSHYYHRWYNLVRLHVIKMRPAKPWERVKLQIYVYLPKRRFRDYDGLVGSAKPLADGLTRAGIIKDDNYVVTGQWDVQQFSEPDKAKTRVEVKIQRVE